MAEAIPSDVNEYVKNRERKTAKIREKPLQNIRKGQECQKGQYTKNKKRETQIQ